MDEGEHTAWYKQGYEEGFREGYDNGYEMGSTVKMPENRTMLAWVVIFTSEENDGGIGKVSLEGIFHSFKEAKDYIVDTYDSKLDETDTDGFTWMIYEDGFFCGYMTIWRDEVKGERAIYV